MQRIVELTFPLGDFPKCSKKAEWPSETEQHWTAAGWTFEPGHPGLSERLESAASAAARAAAASGETPVLPGFVGPCAAR